MTSISESQTYVFSPPYADLTINRELLEKVLGYRSGGAPEVVRGLIDETLPEIPSRISVRCGFHILPVGSIAAEDKSLSFNGIRLETGSIIADRLRASTTLAVFLATIGPHLEEWSRELMAGGDALRGYIVDAIASETVEQAAEWLEQKLADRVRLSGWNLTNRYSPGYCGWSVAEQQKLFSLLPKKFCGVELTPSSLMLPIKSVSGVIGLGSKVKRDPSVCSICDMKDCFRRFEDHR